MQLQEKESKDLAHFLTIARRGRLPGCSNGEHAAHQLAAAALLRAPSLDDSALSGFYWFCVMSQLHNVEAAKALRRGD